MRVVLFTGKGGVGKTTVAASTALVGADEGVRTLVVSTDPAHSLGDVLDRPLGPDPVEITPNLDAAHLDGRVELERSWDVIAAYLRDVLGLADLDHIHTEELVVLPGLDQLLALSRLRKLATSGRWAAIVVDCASSADSLRLLSLPDALRWYVDRLFGRSGVIGGWVRRRVERSLAVPSPGEDVADAVRGLAADLTGLRELLHQDSASARVVVTPEAVVLAEAQRTVSYLALYGFTCDALVVNRQFPPTLRESPLGAWREAHEHQMSRLDELFGELPRIGAVAQPAEPVGLAALRRLGAELYPGGAALAKLASRPALEIHVQHDTALIRLPVGGLAHRDISVHHSRDVLVLSLGSYRRALRLPDGLRKLVVKSAAVREGVLELSFGES
jgi:arsenite-transporting ATPase